MLRFIFSLSCAALCFCYISVGGRGIRGGIEVGGGGLKQEEEDVMKNRPNLPKGFVCFICSWFSKEPETRIRHVSNVPLIPKR